jgi:hypothetical protein
MKKKAGKLFGAKLEFSNKIKNILKKYGNQKIRSIYIGRRPINSMVEKAFNIISLGKWSKLREQYYYDKLFHLFLIIQMDDDTVISFEKNSIVTMTEDDERCSMKDTECVKIEYPTDSLTLDEFVRKPLERIGKDKFFVYQPFDQNCQIFIRAVLETFGLYSKKVADFVYQDISEIVERLPFYVKYVAKAVTDLDATKSKISGAGCGCKECELSGGSHCDKCPLIEKQDDLEILTHFVTDMLKNKK